MQVSLKYSIRIIYKTKKGARRIMLLSFSFAHLYVRSRTHTHPDTPMAIQNGIRRKCKACHEVQRGGDGANGTERMRNKVFFIKKIVSRIK